MTDPLYEYVKGKGWVVQNSYLTLHGGVVVRLEFRKPELGERYCSFGYEDSFNSYIKDLNNNPTAYYYDLFYKSIANEDHDDTYYITLVKIS